MSNETASGSDAPASEATPPDEESAAFDSVAEGAEGAEGAEEGAEDTEVSPDASLAPASNSATETEEATGEADVSSPPPRLSPVERMEVRVDFEVGRVTLPVSSLANVAAGSVIEMPGVALDGVVAKSGGQAFAYGEFVELGGRVGFRILRLAEAKEKC